MTAGDVPPAASAAGLEPRWRKPVLIGAAALVCVLVVAGGIYAAMNKTVTISVDGVSQEVSTLAGSVDGALDAAGLTVAEHDTLAPAADAAITDGSQIVLERGRLLTLTVDGADPTGLDHRHHRRGGAAPNWARIRRPSSCPPTGPGQIPLDGLTVTADTLRYRHRDQ